MVVEEMVKIKREKLSYEWLAGFFDAEGCVYIGKFPYWGASLSVSMSQNDSFLLKEILSFIGFGNGPRSYRNQNWSEISFGDRDSEKLLERMLPYLKVKVLQARLALQFMELKVYDGRPLSGKEVRWRKMHYELMRLYKRPVWLGGSSEISFRWLAGFFDGEGSCCKSKRWNVLLVQIGQKDPRILERIRSFLGYGKVYYDKNWDGFSFRCVNKEALKFLRDVLPFLKVKFAKAVSFLES